MNRHFRLPDIWGEDAEEFPLGYAINQTPPLGVERRKKQNQILGLHRRRSSLVYLDQIPAASRSSSYQDSQPSSKKSALDKNPSSRRRQKDLIRKKLGVIGRKEAELKGVWKLEKSQAKYVLYTIALTRLLITRQI